MKVFLSVILSSLVSIAWCQKVDTVEVSNSMTTTIVFDSNIVFADIGSNLYLPRPKNNVLMLNIKSLNTINAPTTTLTVKTENKVSVWIVVQRNKPKKLLHLPDEIQVGIEEPLKEGGGPNVNSHEKTELPSNQVTGQPSKVNNENKKLEDVNIVNSFPPPLKNKLETIFKSPRVYKDVAEIKNHLQFTLHSIHVDKEYMYFTITLANYSSIAYAIDYLSITHVPYVKGMRKAQVASGENLEFKYEYSLKEVSTDEDKMLVYAVPLEAFDNKDNLEFKISENKGKRTLKFVFPCIGINLAKQI